MFRKSIVFFAATVLLSVAASTYARDILILTAEKPTVTEKFAAEELQKYLEKITGENFEVKNSKERARLTITVANQQMKRLNLSFEEYVIKSVRNGLILSGGGDRGTLYAVYDFLEKLGCRWYYPDEPDEIVPRLTVDEVLKASENLDFVERPDFSVRMYQLQTYDIGNAGEQLADGVTKESLFHRIDWLAKNRTNIFQYAVDHGISGYNMWSRYRAVFPEMQKRAMVIGTGGHNMFLFITGAQLRQHPNWQCFRGGQRTLSGQFCTSNDEAVREYITNLVNFLKVNPEIEFITPWPHDMGNWCECDMCKDQTVGDRYLELSNTVYRTLKEKRPDVTFTHFPYGSHMMPPENVKPERGMYITLCTWGRNFDYTINDARTSPQFRNALQAWSDLSKEYDNTFIYHEKYLRHLGFGFLPLPLKILKPEMQYLHSIGLDGFELPTGFFGRRAKSLNSYVTFKLIWDINADVDAIVDDYFDKMYGRLSAVMRKAYGKTMAAQPDLRYFRQFNKLHWDFEHVLDAYAAAENDYALNAIRHLVYAGEYVDKALAACDDEAIRRRIEKFGKSLRYVEIAWRGRGMMTKAAGYIESLAQASDSAEYVAKLNLAEDCINKAEIYAKQRDAIATEVPGSGLYWDATWNEQQGTIKSSHVKNWRELIAEKRKEGLGK